MDYNIRARGCDSVLKSVKPIFSKHFTKNVYKEIHGFKMPDITEFREMSKIPNIPPAQYEAPDEAMINKVLGSINKLYEECLDTWLTFILSYAIGLRWSEIRSARYSWFGHEMAKEDGPSVTTAMCRQRRNQPRRLVRLARLQSPRRHTTWSWRPRVSAATG